MSTRYPLFVKRDLDGFFGLAIDNLVQLLLVLQLCHVFCGMSQAFIASHILPGIAVSLVIGNVFYALQAHWVARKTGQSDVTALPYGVNTPSLLVYVFFVMKPAFDRTGDPSYAWKLGLLACVGSGIIEFVGAFFAERVRQSTPRAALLSTLAGIAITFISMKFALEIWQRPLVSMAPLAIVLLVFFAKVRFPMGLPGGLAAVLLGTALAWGLTLVSNIAGYPLTSVMMSTESVNAALQARTAHWPMWAGGAIWETLRDHSAEVWSMISVILPMGIFNVVGSLQNIESAEAGGDRFATGPSLAVNGIGTLAAACFGSCFPTTIYIGHPGWKALGARAGYSTLNALFMTAICLTGTVGLIKEIIPIEAGIGIVLWIGIIITAQSFQTTPLRHAPAVAIGLFPAIAAWGATIMAGAFVAMSVYALKTSQPMPATMQTLLESDIIPYGINADVNGFLIHGLTIMERGFIFTCMIVSAVCAFLIDRRFRTAAWWCVAASLLTFSGLIHAYRLDGNTVDYFPLFASADEGVFSYRAIPIAIGYLMMAAVFLVIHRYQRDLPAPSTEALSTDRPPTDVPSKDAPPTDALENGDQIEMG